MRRNLQAKKQFKLWVRTHCTFSLQRPSPAPAPRHQTPIYFSLQNLAKENSERFRSENRGNGHEIILIELFCWGRWLGIALIFVFYFCFRVLCMGWLPNFFVMSPQSLLYLGCSLGISILFFCGLWPLLIFTFPQ